MEARVQEVKKDFLPVVGVLVGSLAARDSLDEDLVRTFRSVDPADLELLVQASWAVEGYGVKVWPHRTEGDYVDFTEQEEAGAPKDKIDPKKILEIARARKVSGLLPVELQVDIANRPDGDFRSLFEKFSELRARSSK